MIIQNEDWTERWRFKIAEEFKATDDFPPLHLLLKEQPLLDLLREMEQRQTSNS